jgi:hypothetical protein
MVDAPDFSGTQSGTVIDKIINNDKINDLRPTPAAGMTGMEGDQIRSYPLHFSARGWKSEFPLLNQRIGDSMIARSASTPS